MVESYDCTIVEGWRGAERQERLHRQGLSRVVWPFGRHNATREGGAPCSLAVDAIPYVSGRGSWNLRQCAHFAGYVQARADVLGIPLRWGGDWDRDRDLYDQTWNDMAHFELVGTLPELDALAGRICNQGGGDV